MSKFIVTGVLTHRKLNAYECSKHPKIKFLSDKELKPGDMVRTLNYDTPIEVLNVNKYKGQLYSNFDDMFKTYANVLGSSGLQDIFDDDFGEPQDVDNLETLEIFSINDELQKNEDNNISINNYKQQKTAMNSVSNGRNDDEMLGGMFDKYKAQFIPVKESGVRMSFTGLICVPVGNEYVGIEADNTLTSFPESMTINIPIYSINKPNNAIKVGDIIKENRSYAKVIGKNSDGSLKVLTYTGYNHNKKEVKDFIMGQSATRVLINMFNFDNSSENSFNPMFYAYICGDRIDVNSLMMLSMMPQGKNLFSNAGGGFNPMWLYFLDSNKGGKSNMMELAMMMSMMNQNQAQVNPMANFANMFNGMTNVAPEQMIVGQNDTDTDDDEAKDAPDPEDATQFSIDDAIEMIMKNPDAVEKLKKSLNKKTTKSK